MTGTTMTMTTTRLPVCFTLGLAITVGLYWFLWTMISAPATLVARPAPPRIDFTRLIVDTEPVPPPIEKPAAPRHTDAPPTDFSPARTDPDEGPGTLVDIPAPPIDHTAPKAGPRHFDGEPTIVVRPPPQYPASAAARSLEGWVMIEFSVTPWGAVADAQVVDAEPRGVFDDAALKAIARWKYNPRVADGAAVERRGMRVVIRFDLED